MTRWCVVALALVSNALALACERATPVVPTSPASSLASAPQSSPATPPSWRVAYMNVTSAASGYDAGPKQLWVGMTLPGAPLLPQITDWLGPPAWSPDGARLLLRTRAGDVVVVSIAGSSQVVAHEGLTEWSWLSDTVVATVARADPDRILVQVDIATRKRTETVLAREATTGAFSGSARFLAFTPPSSGGAETYLIDLRVPHVARRAGAGVVRGWTADEQLVVHAAGSPGSLRSVDPVTLEQRVLLADARDGIASPRASAAVGIDGSGALWVIRPGESAVRQPGPSVAGTLAALSANAVAIGLVDRRPQPTGNDRIRAVVRIVATGEDLSACDNGCGDVALR